MMNRYEILISQIENPDVRLCDSLFVVWSPVLCDRKPQCSTLQLALPRMESGATENPNANVSDWLQCSTGKT